VLQGDHVTTSDSSIPNQPEAIPDEPEAIPDTPEAPAAAGDTLARSVAGMSDAELRELAGAVLAELRARTNDPSSKGFSYQNLVSDLRRRLADAHAYAQSGFGHRDKRLTKPAAASLALPAPAPLSEEKKAMLLTGLEAELLSGFAPSDPAEFVDLPVGWDLPAEPGDGGEAPAETETPEPAASIEAEIWEALQIEVGRAASHAPATKDGKPGG
jgi:hypothetical protein